MILESDVRSRIESAVLYDNDPRGLARLLFGPMWSEVVRETREGWRATRYPHATQLAEFIATNVGDAIAHDGRSERDSTSTGWMARRGETWEPVDVFDVGAAIVAVLEDALEMALAVAEQSSGRIATARDDIAAAQRITREDHRAQAVDAARVRVDAASASASEERLRAALLSSLCSCFASQSRNFASAMRGLRSRLTLPADAVPPIALAWLEERLEVGDVVPSAAGRVLVADVRAALDRYPSLPVQAMFRGLDTALGARLRRVEWQLSDDVEVVS